MKTSARKAFLAAVLGTTAAWSVIRTEPPPPVTVAVIGHPPTARHIWVPGYYKGVSGRYVWVPGKWMIPPRPGAVWVPAIWRQGPNGYTYVAGHWR